MDEESRLREALTKKKIVRKMERKKSGELDDSPGKRDDKQDRGDNNGKNGDRKRDRDGGRDKAVDNMKKMITDNIEKEKATGRNEKRRRRNRRRNRPRDRDYPPPPPRDNRDYYGGGGYRDYYPRNDRYREPPRWRPPPGRDDHRGRGRYRRDERSYSRSVSYSRSRSGSRGRYSTSRSRSRSYSSSRSRSASRGRSYSCSPERKRSTEEPEPEIDESTKDLRTIFVSSLVMKATESDIRRYFRKFLDGPRWTVREVILLRDRRTGRHKGGCYVELATSAHVDKALNANGVVPDFQRFPISVKRSEAEKNDFGPLINNTAGGHAVQYTPDGKRIEAQKVYVGSIDQCVTQAQLHALFSGFGVLEKVLLQVDTTTGISRGYAFLSYKDPKDANLAIQTMSGQIVAGQALKTGWANLQSAAAGVEEIRSDEFPPDADEKIKKVNATLVELTGSGLATLGGAAVTAASLGVLPSSQLKSVAEAALDAALGGATATLPIPAAIAQPAAGMQPTAASASAGLASPAPASTVADATVVGRLDNPSQHILVHNMFDKDEETDPGWENDIRLDFEDECQQYGKINTVLVMSKDPGGKIYATFESQDGAMKCAKSLAGRWFDKRQLRVEFVDSIPSSS